jgi:hypothetical protein
MFQGSNALKNSVGILASKEQCDGLAWSEATGEEIGANIGRVLCPML